MARHDPGHAFTGERRGLGEQFKNDATDRIQIGALVDVGVAIDLFGRHVVRRAHHGAGLGHLGL